jgi:hypothetical protein
VNYESSYLLRITLDPSSEDTAVPEDALARRVRLTDWIDSRYLTRRPRETRSARPDDIVPVFWLFAQ